MKTPLFFLHKDLGAKFVDFGGWQLPVFYTSVVAEHHAVRSSCGIFDVSHMGEIAISGPKAKSFLNYIVLSDVGRLGEGQGQYTAMCTPSGGIIDDLILYRLTEEVFLLCVNASRINADWEWLQQKAAMFASGLNLENQSSRWAQLALQGPSSAKVLACYLGVDNAKFLGGLSYGDIVTLNPSPQLTLLVARTGYTGELGYELYVAKEHVCELWENLFTAGEEFGISAAGLGARDTLRLESCYPLYGNDIDVNVSPLEAGLSRLLNFAKGDFCGRDVLYKEKMRGPQRLLRAFKLCEPGVARQGMQVYSQDARRIGFVTSGSVLPSVGGAGGLALVSSSVGVGEQIYIDVRGKKKRAAIVKKPFYKVGEVEQSQFEG